MRSCYKLIYLIFLFIFLSLSVHANQQKKLYQIIDEDWQHALESDPLFATMVGDERYNDILPSILAEDLLTHNDIKKALLERAEKIKRDKLNSRDQVNLDMLIRKLDNDIASYQFKNYLLPINADSGFHTELVQMVSYTPLANTRDFENYIARLNQVKRLILQHIEHMRTGLKHGITLPKIVLQGYETGISAHVVDQVENSAFYKPFKHFPLGVPASDYKRLRNSARAAIKNSVIPGYKAFLDFMLNEYRPGARNTIAASDLPDGKAYYAYLVKKHTTLDITPQAVHGIGLQEVKRIRAQMDSIIKRLEFKGSFKDFLHFLRTDKQFYATSSEQLLKEARDISKRMDAKLPSLFKTLPRTPYGVEAVPEEIAAKYTAGRYVGARVGGTEPGYYWVNTYALEKRPLYNLPALSLHEAVPGHHLQISLAKENRTIPNFRRFDYVTAFGEGWGLYSEKLGVEAGIYRTDYEHFGRLSYEMWRACRLVVDTGMHAMAWTREQALQFMSANTALSLHNVTTEIDRYIAWPGQALAYKMGELKILELRKKAEVSLGANFDIREFHDAVLQNGGVPMQILEQQVDRYIQNKRKLAEL